MDSPQLSYDVVVVGAGISGLDAAFHLKTLCPSKSFCVLESRENIGGTWDFFKYPGLRSDSDMFTFGYKHKPWMDDKTIAPAKNILRYLNEMVEENDLRKYIFFNHQVVAASWESLKQCWNIQCSNGISIECTILFMNTGYYKYDRGYTPEFCDIDMFVGRIVHPQDWADPKDGLGPIELENKKVVLIGSGATAVTLLPNLAKKAGHVTMLQRSPTYYLSRPGSTTSSKTLSSWGVPDSAIHSIFRAQNIIGQQFLYNLMKLFPSQGRWLLKKGARRLLPKMSQEEFNVHFTPHYDPWDQRLCLCPDGDFFKALNSNKACIITDHIDRFTATGVQLKSGNHLEADLIVTATGFNLQDSFPVSGCKVTIDGKPYHAPDHMAYKGIMCSDIPNMFYTMGYTNASWTLKADLSSSFVCRVLNFMDKKNFKVVVPRGDPNTPVADQAMELSSGYILRSQNKLPKQGTKQPWKLNNNYFLDKWNLSWNSLEDGVLEFQPRKLVNAKL